MTTDQHCDVPPEYRRKLRATSCHPQKLYDLFITEYGLSWELLWNSSTPFLLKACQNLDTLSCDAVADAELAFREATRQLSTTPKYSRTVSPVDRPKAPKDASPDTEDVCPQHDDSATKRQRITRSEHFGAVNGMSPDSTDTSINSKISIAVPSFPLQSKHT